MPQQETANTPDAPPAVIHGDADTAAAVAAAQLLTEYGQGRLLTRPDLQPFLHPAGEGTVTVSWHELLHAMDPNPGPGARTRRPTLAGTSHAVVMLACMLATGGPVHDLGGILAHFDHDTATVALRAFHTAMHHGTPPPPGWPGLAVLTDTPLFDELRQRHYTQPVTTPAAEPEPAAAAA